MLISPNIKLVNEVSRSTSIQPANHTKRENAPRSHLPQSLQLQSGSDVERDMSRARAYLRMSLDVTLASWVSQQGPGTGTGTGLMDSDENKFYLAVDCLYPSI